MKMSLQKKIAIISSIIIVLALIIVPTIIINSINSVTQNSITGSWSCVTTIDEKSQEIRYTFYPDKTFIKKIIMADETQEHQLKYYKISFSKIKLSKTEELKYDKLSNMITDEINGCTFTKTN